MKIETQNKVYKGIAVLVCLLALGGVAKAAVMGYLVHVDNGTFNLGNYSGGVQVSNGGNLGSAQTAAVYATNADTVTNLDSLFLWGTGSDGGLEVAGVTHLVGATTITGAATLNGLVTLTGTTIADRMILGGNALALTAVATSTLSGAQICDSSFISITPVSTTPTITLPSTTTLFAACIGTVGQYVDVFYQSITTSTILAAGAGGTTINSSALTVAAGKAAILRFIHNSDSLSGTYLVGVVNLLN